MKYGYARISTKDQNLNMQIDALEQYGCQKIYSEQYSDYRTDDRDHHNNLDAHCKGGNHIDR